MAEWTTGQLGDFITFQRGFDITRSTQRVGAVPVVSSGGVSSYHDTAATSGPGVVIGRKGTLGKVYYLPGDYWPHDTTLWVKDFKGSWPRFVYYFMTQLDTLWLDAGSANPTLNRNHLHPLQVSWPPRPEQVAIAEVLGALDDKIAANTRLATTADELATTDAGSVQPSVPVGSIARVSRSTVDPSTLGGTAVTLFSLPGFDAGRQPERVPAPTVKSGKFDVREPAVLVSKLNPRIPRVWEVPAIPPGATLASTEFVVLHPTESDTAVLWALLSDPRFGTTLESMVAGTSGSHQRVKPDEVLSALVGDPTALSPATREAISALARRAHAARDENLTLAAIRDALLPALMSGALRVRDAERLAEHLT